MAHGDPRLPKNRGQLRDLLGDVMVRHTRSQGVLDLSMSLARKHYGDLLD